RARPDRSSHMGLLLSNQLALADREIISVDQFLLGNQGLFIELILDFLAQLGREVSPDVLAACLGVLVGRLGGLHGADAAGQGTGGRAGLLALLLTGPADAA